MSELLQKFNTNPNINLPLEVYTDNHGNLRAKVDNFDWGENLSYADIVTMEREIFYENVYCCWRNVQENDIVVDVGASVGPFVHTVIKNKPKKIYCIEPSKKLVKTIEKNFGEYIWGVRDTSLTIVNKAIVSNPNANINIFGGQEQEFDVITFKKFIDDYSIQKINFLKIDCEGGEYDIFQEENMNFLLNNVEYMAIEIHLNYEGCRDKFKNFRDKYLTQFQDYQVMSCTRQNISWGNSINLKDKIFDNDFIDQYDCEIMIYIWN